MSDKTITNEFVEFLEQARESRKKQWDEISLLHKVFKLLDVIGAKSIDWAFENYTKYPDNEHYWFERFHKDFRQIDIFQPNGGVGETVIGAFTVNITEKQFAKRKDLLRKSYQAHQEGTEPLTGEERKLLRHYNTLYHSYIPEDGDNNVSSILDMLCYQVISIHSRLLYDLMLEFFKTKKTKETEESA